MASCAFHITWDGKNGEYEVWPNLKTVVTSVAQDDKLSSHQCTMLPASGISTGLSDEPSLGSDSRTRVKMDSSPSLCSTNKQTPTRRDWGRGRLAILLRHKAKKMKWKESNLLFAHLGSRILMYSFSLWLSMWNSDVSLSSIDETSKAPPRSLHSKRIRLLTQCF